MAFVAVKLLNVGVTFSEDLFKCLRLTVPAPNPNDLRWKSKQQARSCFKAFFILLQAGLSARRQACAPPTSRTHREPPEAPRRGAN
jgi:hypothetical protein